MKSFWKFLKWILIVTTIIIVITIILNILIPTTPPVRYSDHVEMYSKTNLNIRSGPGTDWEVLKTLSPNDKIITYDSIVDGFIMVLNEDSTKYGWTAFNYLQSIPLSQKQLEDIKNKTTVSDELLKYSIHKEDVSDTPIKTQVSLDIIIEDKIMDEQRIRKLLKNLYNTTVKRSGFRHHNNPTNIYIYAYTSKDKAESGMGQWVGMISKSYDDKNPTINISETQLKALTEVKETKWNLTYHQRQQIWNKIIKAEDKAQEEADEKYPLDKPGITQSDIGKNVDLMEELKEKYKAEIANEYGIEEKILESIIIEGVKNGWAFPK